ncbi:MAG: FAD-dependent oxidoreductase [Salinarimonas sp.]|nr:FAD-dependent oxidoreductase [Salinarimonas sp.]
MTSVKRIAVIGAGIAGNGAAWALHHGSDHEITVFEREPRAGGHSATVDIDYDGRAIAVDTGFIVFNELNYPNLTRLFAHLGVETFESDMTFSVSDESGRVAWSSRPQDYLGGLFPGSARLPSPVHLQVLGDLVRFNRAGVADLHAGRLRGLTLGEYLERGGFSRRFREDYLIAMGSAIWSMPPGSVLDFPAEAFLSFFENHRLLRMSQPTWRTVAGGSRTYVEALTRGFADRLHLGSPVKRVIPGEGAARVVLENGAVQDFDAVVLACHSDQALALLGEEAGPRAQMLASISYRANPVYLHSDAGLMPQRKSAWAAWNVIKRNDQDVSVSYWMNALQGIDPACPLFVTLNPSRPPAPEHTFARFDYAHPQFDRAALAAQGRLPALQGRDGIWFCGAWTGYGFHEDGLLSGLNVAEALGAQIPWRLTPRQFQAAAE